MKNIITINIIKRYKNECEKYAEKNAAADKIMVSATIRFFVLDLSAILPQNIGAITETTGPTESSIPFETFV
ncbi:hypothetical protein SDC9_138325 [bioreactor metagenome]|uniref:Uncharacterized protein n=1 Tax=bioreactor metagenome TaxID=1076179 RepID=A0A645DPZ2_9ZZZZ